MHGSKTKMILTGMTLAVALGCQAQAPAPETTGAATPAPKTATVITGVGFSTPEAILHDSEADVYLVSQINGSPLETDGNGFVSRVSPDGTVAELRWIDGRDEGTELHAPKGMALVGNRLYVADIDTVRVFDRASGEPKGEIVIVGATFLNDLVAAPQGGVYATDSGLKAGDSGLEPSGSAAVYHISTESKLTAVLKDPEFPPPNGIAVDGERLLVVTFSGNQVYAIQDGEAVVVAELPTGGLDGIVPLPDGRWAISSWEGKAVYAGPLEGPYEVLVDGIESPADIAVDTVRRALIIPSFNGHEVVIHPLK
jgi:DNA-binding beta-propeller fold protein YncE